MKRLKKTPVAVTGGFRSRCSMEAALSSGYCNIIGVGRPLCGDPKCVSKLLRGEVDSLPRYEKIMDLPWFLRWVTIFQMGRMVKNMSTMIWGQHQLVILGRGQPSDVNGNKVAIASMRFIKKYDSDKASKLLGPEVAECVGTVLHAKTDSNVGMTLALLCLPIAAFARIMYRSMHKVPITILVVWLIRLH